MKKLLLEEKGQAIVLVPILLVVLIGFAGLAIDGGRLYIAKSELQKAVDAGALAGADVLLDQMKGGTPVGLLNFTSVSDKVSEITTNNYGNGTYTYDPNQHGYNAVEVSGDEKVNLLLMPVLGLNESMVHALARVKIGNVSTMPAGSVIPVGVNFDMLKDPNDPTGTDLQYDVEMTITDSPGTGLNGYYGFLNFSSLPGADGSNGADALKDYILHGSPVPISIGQEINQENGVNTGKVDSAISQRVGDIVYVPIVSGPNSNGNMVVEGFAAFELIDYVTQKEGNGKNQVETHTITAKFLHIASEGEIGGGTIDYGVYDSKLEL